MKSNIVNNEVISSGFVIKNNRNEFLLGKINAHIPPYQYSVFKGQQELNENLMQTAIRELKEETGIDLSQEHRLNRYMSSEPLFQYRVRNKTVFLFFLEDEEDVLANFYLHCSSLWQDTNEPEISGYKWVHISELFNHILPSQRGLAEFIINKYSEI